MENKHNQDYIKGWNDALEMVIKEARTMAQDTRPRTAHDDLNAGISGMVGYTDYVPNARERAAFLALGVWTNRQKMS